MKYSTKKFIRSCSVKFLPDESRVQGGLAYTPSDMLRASRDGRAIAPANMSDDYFSETDNKSSNDFSTPPEYTRGVDVNDMWEAAQEAKRKIRKARREGAFQPLPKGGE